MPISLLKGEIEVMKPGMFIKVEHPKEWDNSLAFRFLWFSLATSPRLNRPKNLNKVYLDFQPSHIWGKCHMTLKEMEMLCFLVFKWSIFVSDA